VSLARQVVKRMPWWMGVLVVVLVAFVVVGVLAVTSELDGLLAWAPAAAVVLALGLRAIGDTIACLVARGLGWLVALVFPRCRSRVEKFVEVVVSGTVVVLTAAVPALFALVGVDVVIAALLRGDRHLPLWAGIPIGVAVIGGATWLYVDVWPDRWVGRPGLIASAVAVALLIVAPPLGVWLYSEWKGDGSYLSPEGSTGSTLEVLVLRDGGGPAPPQHTTSGGWAVTTWVGAVASDGTVRWGQGGAPPPVPEADADRVLLIEPHGRPTRWLAAADRVTPLSTPVFALLDREDSELPAWKSALRPGWRHGRPVALGRPAPAALPATAVKLVEVSPTADEDLALAVQHRPALFFDLHEPYPFLYNVDRLIKSGEMSICPRGKGAPRVLCKSVDQPNQLHRDAGRLTFNPKRLARTQDSTTMYVHVVRTAKPPRTYLDYWWYFPYNPARSGEGAMCGAGLDLGDKTCFDHDSDWEGVTVELDSQRLQGPPLAVLYAQHNHARRYTWPALRELWRNRAAAKLAQVGDPQRPLVFPARGTHASYPFPCPASRGDNKCHTREVPPDRAQKITDNGFDGHTGWEGNGNGCLPGCVTPFPTRDLGRRPASWNAFAGHWGTADCVLVVICSESEPPLGPSEQRHRYAKPWCAARVVDFVGGDWHVANGGRCGDRSPPAQPHQLKLAALGDSFSSGQGGGDYDQGTTGHGNTCFRSDNAWPQRLADAMDWVVTDFLACNGARTDELILNGHSHNGEKERNRSQISRITDHPDIITLTIGGNDLGFADVVTDCARGNCATDAEAAKIAAKLDRLKQKLPRVYAAVREAAPGARLIVIDYPRLLPQGTEAEESPNCAVDPPGKLTTNEVEFLNAHGRELDAVIAQDAKQAGADFVEVSDAFAGHELHCGLPAPYVNPIRYQSDPRHASFHPTADGYSQLADIVARHLADEGVP
jgi:lysophospholipase L1-like esterase